MDILRKIIIRMNIILFMIICAAIIAQRAHAFEDINDKINYEASKISGKESISLMFATKDGLHAEFINEINDIGGKIHFSAEDIGYVRATIPTKNIGKISRSSLILSMNFVGGVPIFNSYENKNVNQPPDKREKLSSIINTGNFSKDLFDYEAMKLFSLRKATQNANGEGINIAYVELFPDPTRAEFLRNGGENKNSAIAEIVDVNSYMSDKIISDSYKPDVNGLFLQKFEANGDKEIVVGSIVVRVPRVGKYYISISDKKSIAGLKKISGNFGSVASKVVVVKHENDSCYLIDTNFNGDVSDEICISDYNKTKQYGEFRYGNNDSDSIRFFLLEALDPNWVIIAIPFEHTHYVASVAVGHRFFNSSIGGTAPAAQLIMITAGPSLASNVEGYIRASYDSRVDIIMGAFCSEGWGTPDNAVPAVILDRIVERKNKIIVMGAGNNANRPSSICSMAVGKYTLAVGQLHSGTAKHNLLYDNAVSSSSMASSGGPLINGRIKPDIIAPSLLIVPKVQLKTGEESFDPLCPQLILPARAMCAEGTSLASPSAAGAIASLLSALRHKGLATNAIDVVRTIRNTAQFSPSVPAYLQGNGIINVELAYRRLTKSTILTSQIVVEAPISHKLYNILTGLSSGEGLFEREGWFVGHNANRKIWVTYQDDKSYSEKFAMRLLGNDAGTFGLDRSVISMSSGVPAPINVSINPKSPGVHSAIIELVNIDGVVVHRLGIVIIAAMGSGNIKSQRKFIIAGRHNENSGIFIPVDEDVDNIAVAYHVSDESVFMLPPSGPLGSELLEQEVNPDESLEKKELRQTVVWPVTGLWEMRLGALGNGPLNYGVTTYVSKVSGQRDFSGERDQYSDSDYVSENASEKIDLGRDNSEIIRNKISISETEVLKVIPLSLKSGPSLLSLDVVWKKKSSKREDGFAVALVSSDGAGYQIKRGAIGIRRNKIVERINNTEGKNWSMILSAINKFEVGDVIEYTIRN